jgi:hypothetical protein
MESISTIVKYETSAVVCSQPEDRLNSAKEIVLSGKD